MITLEHLTRGLPEHIKHYLSHIGKILCNQDYDNKIFILEGMCLESKGKGCRISAVRALDYIQKYGGKQ